MDKETLSNYGWVVIAVLILAVMIALATPFGKFISSAVQSTVQGLFDVNDEALSAADILIEDKEIEKFMPKTMSEYGFYYDTEYIWVYSEDNSIIFSNISFIFKPNGDIQIKESGVENSEIIKENLEYSHLKIIGKNDEQDVVFSFSGDGKTLTYQYKNNPAHVFGMVE